MNQMSATHTTPESTGHAATQSPEQAQVRWLVLALAEDRLAAQRLAKTWGTTLDRSWSALDLVVQQRKRAVQQGAAGKGLLCSIDGAMHGAWQLAAMEVANGEATSGEVLHALGVITQHIPAPDIVEGLVHGMAGAAQRVAALMIGTPEGTQPVNDRQAKDRLALLVQNTLPTWLRVLDRQTEDEIEVVLRAPGLVTGEGYFTGLVWAWRFGLRHALAYANALTCVLGSAALGRPQAGLEVNHSSLNTLKEAMAMGSPPSRVACHDAGLIKLFATLKNCTATADWNAVLIDELINIPHLAAALRNNAWAEKRSSATDATDTTDATDATATRFAANDADANEWDDSDSASDPHQSVTASAPETRSTLGQGSQ